MHQGKISFQVVDIEVFKNCLPVLITFVLRLHRALSVKKCRPTEETLCLPHHLLPRQRIFPDIVGNRLASHCNTLPDVRGGESDFRDSAVSPDDEQGARCRE